MRTLALTTSSSLQGICLRVPGRPDAVVQAAHKRGQPRQLTRWIWQVLDDVGMRPGDLDLLVCDVGPGSFTGLRLGLATVRALAWAEGLATVGVGSLDAMLADARDRLPRTPCLAVVPARRGVIYAGLAVDGADAAQAEVPLAELGDWLDATSPAGAPAVEAIVGPQNTIDLSVSALGRDLRSLELPAPEPEILLRLGLAAHAAGAGGTAFTLQPRYLAVSEAERNAARLASRPGGVGQ